MKPAELTTPTGDSFSHRLNSIQLIGWGLLSLALSGPWWMSGLPPAARAETPGSGTAPVEGLHNNTPAVYALQHATIVTRPGQVIQDGVLIIRDGVVAAVGHDLAIPQDARRLEMSGKFIYPGFLDCYCPMHLTTKSDSYWNDQIQTERSAADDWQPESGQNKRLRGQGIVLRLVAPDDGILQGASALVTTGDGRKSDLIVRDRAAFHLRLTTSPRGNRDRYPNSPMGAVALARQALYDAEWYEQAWNVFQASGGTTRPETNSALRRLAALRLPETLFICDAPDEQYFLRADRFAREFALRAVIRGSGREYRRLEAIRATGRAVIVPLDFPKPPDVRTPEAALQATLEELMHWQLAPTNAAKLAAAGIDFAFTTHGMQEEQTLLAQVRKCIDRGLPRDQALRALTLAGAEMLGVQDRIGSLESGKTAHLVVTDGELFAAKTQIVETWVDGKRYQATPPPPPDVRGTWRFRAGPDPETAGDLYVRFTGDIRKPTANLARGLDAFASAAEQPDGVVDFTIIAWGEQSQLAASFSQKLWAQTGAARLSATYVDSPSPHLIGQIVWHDGRSSAIRMERIGDLEEPAAGQPGGESAQAPGPAPSLPPAGERPAAAETLAGTTAAAASAAASSGSPSPEVNYPLGAFGRDGPPELLDRFALTNATIWTCGPPGKLEQATLLVEHGKIAAVGTNLQLPADTRRIDVGGRHVTPGIIDCHSHMATDGGVNESGQAITAEVRIGDFIDANDISIYRQLAGGVTTANILHGSANPIGGQNQLIKLRWGSLPEQLKLAGAPGGIKFALGENVKQSNSQSSTRYPQTRMGVEQLIRDALHAAQAYDLRRREWQDRGTGLPPRRDLELDALAEVLNHQRWIHCHSYRQDEILAVLRTLESFDVQMGTLQHVLEGYKVAEELRRHGAMASAFSDWWAYKFEVFDAIPYNGALMHEAGVVVSFNSDDQELARHLNQEAAKAVKYGNVPAEEALKFVTLNPARQLRIDDQVGSLEVGKDADFVVWSSQPLSNFSRCEQTWIDGRRYFDMDQDRQWRERDETLRRKLIAQIIDSGEAMLPADEKPPREADLWPREDEFCKRNDHGR